MLIRFISWILDFKWVSNLLWRVWYKYVARVASRDHVTFMNYGYHSPGLEPLKLQRDDEENRICIQLYHATAAPFDISGKAIAEVSCGQGGGASYLARYLKPASYVALDRTENAIAYNKETYSEIKGLSFVCGNALDLPFENEQFDALINVEASHCYPDIPKFFSEVHRVLKKEGRFLYTDFRDATYLEDWQKQLTTAGFEIVEIEDITDRVLHGMDENDKAYREIIDRVAPRLLRKHFYQFAGTKGSIIYTSFSSGKKRYIRYVLKKS
ncbi:MAG: class I SAM-dependent methyltransferase [Lentisphaeria bacterium]|nr:class I SAM-dependent methyltransferase [Lentisphaeria bacterium]